MRGAAAAILPLLLLSACSSTGRWQLVRQLQPESKETLVTFVSVPEGAEVTVNGNYVGETPLELRMKHRARPQVWERWQPVPYPHVEEKTLYSYIDNDFTVRFVKTGFFRKTRELELHGEEELEVKVELIPKSR